MGGITLHGIPLPLLPAPTTFSPDVGGMAAAEPYQDLRLSTRGEARTIAGMSSHQIPKDVAWKQASDHVGKARQARLAVL